MNYNSKINWQPGMEITAETMRLADSTIYFRNRFALQLAMGGGSRGVMPGTELSCSPAFVGRTVEIIGMKMTAMLPSGEILCIDDDVMVGIDKEKIENLTNDTELVHKIYFAVFQSDKDEEYEVEDMPLMRPAYRFDFCSESEVQESDCIPLARLLVDDGSLSIDEKFVIPRLIANDNSLLVELHDYLKESLDTISKHPNLEKSDLRLALVQASYHSNVVNMRQQSAKYTNMVYEEYCWQRYYVEEYVKAHKLTNDPSEYKEGQTVGEAPQLPELIVPNCANMDIFVENIRKIQQAISDILDICIVEDHSIDFDALKAQIIAEVLGTVRPDVSEQITTARTEIHDQLQEELDQRLRDLADELMEKLRETLRGQLYDDLYQPLYDALYDALKDIIGTRPAPVEVDDFMPMI